VDKRATATDGKPEPKEGTVEFEPEEEGDDDWYMGEDGTWKSSKDDKDGVTARTYETEEVGEDGTTVCTEVMERHTRYSSYFPCMTKHNNVGRFFAFFALPVDEDDMIMFEGVAEIFQTHVFLRFMIRAAARTCSGFSFGF